MPGGIEQMGQSAGPPNLIEEARMDARSGMAPHQRNTQHQQSNHDIHS